jgi:uroporphyrinogen III methyltransferase / synthase
MSGVFVLGVGPGDPALMSRRALDLLARAAAIAVDGEVPALLLALADPDAIRLDLAHVRPGTVVLSRDPARTAVRLGAQVTELVPSIAEDARTAWLASRPLRGARVLVVRPREQALETARELADLGALPLICRVSSIVDAEALEGVLWPLPGAYEWAAFASAHAVAATFRALGRLGRDARALAGTKLAAVGHATAEALETRGVRADVVPAVHTGAALAHAMLEADPALRGGARVLLPRAAEGRPELAEVLAEHGAAVTSVVAYRNVPRPAAEIAAELAPLTRGEVDVALFHAPSQVALVCDAVGTGALAEVGTIGAIGPTTAQALSERGVRVDFTAAQAVAEALASRYRPS